MLANGCLRGVCCVVFLFVAGWAWAGEQPVPDARTAAIDRALDSIERNGWCENELSPVQEQIRSSQDSMEATDAALSLHRQTDVFGYGILTIPRT
jgi:hypothetical protein